MTCLCGHTMKAEIKKNCTRYFCTNCGNYEIVEMNEVKKK